MMQDWEWEEEQHRRQTETFKRIHRLRKAGYVIAWTRDVEDALFLDHLGSGPDLIIYPCGKIVSLDKSSPLSPKKGEDSDRILNLTLEDVADFECWLAAIKRPTWWQRGAPDREKYIYVPTAFIFIILGSFGFAKMVEAIWHHVFG